LRNLVDGDTKRALVYQALTLRGPSTDKELAAYMAWPINCLVPRRNELVRAGVIVSTGQRRGGGTLWRVK
jgi:hypothetical protein